MATLDEQMKRFNTIEKHVENNRREYGKKEAQFEVQKEAYREKKEELAEAGITFKTGKELQKIYKEKEQRVEDFLTEMEKAIGLTDVEDDEDDEDEEDFNMFDD